MTYTEPVTDWHVSYFPFGDAYPNWRICAPGGTCLRDGDGRSREFWTQEEAEGWLEEHREELPDPSTYWAKMVAAVNRRQQEREERRGERALRLSARPWDAFQLEEDFEEQFREIRRVRAGKGWSVVLVGAPDVFEELATVFAAIYDARGSVGADEYEDHYQAGQAAKKIKEEIGDE